MKLGITKSEMDISRYDVRTEGEKVESRKRRAVSSSVSPDSATNSSAGGPTYQFFVPPGSLSPGIIFVGFDMPGQSHENNSITIAW